MRLEIRALTGVSQGDIFRFNVTEAEGIIIGRAQESDLVLDHPLVSRKHAQITILNGAFYLEDFGSTHGTLHMGFKLSKNDKRQMSNGDEFKIADLLFCIGFEEEVVKKTEKNLKTNSTNSSKKNLSHRGLKNTRLPLYLILTSAFVGVYFLFGTKTSSKRQSDYSAKTLPSYTVNGYWPSSDKKYTDLEHIDLVKFNLPASDVLIEYQYRSEAPVAITLSGGSLDKLPPLSDHWANRQIIVRGLVTGEIPTLIFDNLNFPQDKAAPQRWGIKDIRATPLTSDITLTFDDRLKECLGLAEGINKTPAGLFNFLRSLQETLVALLNEEKIDGASFEIDLGSDPKISFSNIEGLKSKLKAIITERKNGMPSIDALDNYRRELSQLIADVDAELWRKVNNRISKAETAAKVKDYINAHDSLISARELFPREEDFRWILVTKLFNDEKIVPKKVKVNPEKFRK